MNYSKSPEFNASGIYMIVSIKKPDRVYIGSAKSFRVRRNAHFNSLRNGNHHTVKLQRHYDKYGEGDLLFLIIENCQPDTLIEREQYYLDLLNSFFNTATIAEAPNLGKTASLETRRKQSDAKKGKHLSPATEFKKGVPTGRHGSPSQEVKDRISETLKKFYAEHPEARQHLSEINKGKTQSPESIEKTRKANIGHECKQETRDKISKANKGRKIPRTWKQPPCSEETREKLRQAGLGKTQSEETKRKRSLSMKIAWQRRKGELL